MTHTTRIKFPEPIDPERLFGAFRKAVGIPDGHPFEVERDTWAGTNVVSMRSQPGGFQAMLWLDICPSGQVECDCETNGWSNGLHWQDGDTQTPNRERCYRRERWFANVMLDTTYGAGGCPVERHMKIIEDAMRELPHIPMTFNNEMTGKTWPMRAGWTEMPPCDMHGEADVA